MISSGHKTRPGRGSSPDKLDKIPRLRLIELAIVRQYLRFKSIQYLKTICLSLVITLLLIIYRPNNEERQVGWPEGYLQTAAQRAQQGGSRSPSPAITAIMNLTVIRNDAPAQAKLDEPVRGQAAGSSPATMTIEVAVFLDNALKTRYAGLSQGLADLNKLVLTIMNQVKFMFQYSSLMKPIDIRLTLIESIKDSERDGTMKFSPDPAKGDIDAYLTNFCKWQQVRLETNRDKQVWWDHAILLSGLDLYKSSPTGNQPGVLGLSWVGGMCKGNYSCTVGEALHLESAFVIAHELGHSLGMMHDGHRNNCDPNKFIMSDKTGAGKVHWSRCSNNYLAEALRRNQLDCLHQKMNNFTTGNAMYDLNKLRMPGQVYNLDDQCRLAYGTNYTHYMASQAPYNNVCQELWCLAGSWSRPVHPALEGSDCELGGRDVRYSCREGKCQPS